MQLLLLSVNEYETIAFEDLNIGDNFIFEEWNDYLSERGLGLSLNPTHMFVYINTKITYKTYFDRSDNNIQTQINKKERCIKVIVKVEEDYTDVLDNMADSGERLINKVNELITKLPQPKSTDAVLGTPHQKTQKE